MVRRRISVTGFSHGSGEGSGRGGSIAGVEEGQLQSGWYAVKRIYVVLLFGVGNGDDVAGGLVGTMQADPLVIALSIS